MYFIYLLNESLRTFTQNRLLLVSYLTPCHSLIRYAFFFLCPQPKHTIDNFFYEFRTLKNSRKFLAKRVREISFQKMNNISCTITRINIYFLQTELEPLRRIVTTEEGPSQKHFVSLLNLLFWHWTYLFISLV